MSSTDPIIARIEALESRVDRHYELLTAAARNDVDLLSRLTSLDHTIGRHTNDVHKILDELTARFDEISTNVTRFCNSLNQPTEGEPNGNHGTAPS